MATYVFAFVLYCLIFSFTTWVFLTCYVVFPQGGNTFDTRQILRVKIFRDLSQLQTFLSCYFNREATLPEFACKVESS